MSLCFFFLRNNGRRSKMSTLFPFLTFLYIFLKIDSELSGLYFLMYRRHCCCYSNEKEIYIECLVMPISCKVCNVVGCNWALELYQTQVF